MTADEIFAKLSAKFPKAEKAAVPIKDYLTVRLASAAERGPDKFMVRVSYEATVPFEDVMAIFNTCNKLLDDRNGP